MICRMCGSNNTDGARFCNYCGSQLDNNNGPNPNPENYPHFAQNPNQGPAQSPFKIYSNMIFSCVSICVSLLFVCCMGLLVVIPLGLGITAVVFSYQTQELLKNGMFEEAKKKSKLAKIFFLSSFGTTIVFTIVGVIISIVSIVTSIGALGGSIGELIKPENSGELQKMLEDIMKQTQQQ